MFRVHIVRRYCDIDRRIGNLAIIVAPRDHMILLYMYHSCIARQAQTQFTATFTRHSVWKTMQNSDNYLKDGYLIDAAWKVPKKQPVGDRAAPHHSTHANDITTLLYFTHSSLFKLPPPSAVAVGRSTEMCGSWDFDVHQSMEFDQRSTSAVHSNKISWVCSYSMSECFSVLINK